MRVKYIKRKTIEIYYSHYKLKANCCWCFLLIGGEQNLWQFDSYIIGAIIGLFYKETTSGTTVVAFIRFYWSSPIPAMFHLQRPDMLNGVVIGITTLNLWAFSQNAALLLLFFFGRERQVSELNLGSSYLLNPLWKWKLYHLIISPTFGWIHWYYRSAKISMVSEPVTSYTCKLYQ